MKPSSDSEFHFSSHSITAFAEVLSLEDSVEARESSGQPILVLLQKDHSSWLRSIEDLARSSARLVIAVDEEWLEDHYLDDHGYGVPLATAYEMVRGELVTTYVMLHHSPSGIARLCAADLTRAYVTFSDGGGCWEELEPEFAKDAAAGIELAEERWFWHHDELTTKDLVAVMQKLDTEERLGLLGPLPGVKLNLGRR